MEPKLPLTVGRFSCYHIQNKYILFCHAFAYFFVIFIVFGKQNVAENIRDQPLAEALLTPGQPL